MFHMLRRFLSAPMFTDKHFRSVSAALLSRRRLFTALLACAMFHHCHNQKKNVVLLCLDFARHLLNLHKSWVRRGATLSVGSHEGRTTNKHMHRQKRRKKRRFRQNCKHTKTSGEPPKQQQRTHRRRHGKEKGRIDLTTNIRVALIYYCGPTAPSPIFLPS